MKVISTYCSAEKDKRIDLIPAYQRYTSERIACLKSEAKSQGTTFMILSGKFGLIHADHPLPNYNHLLRESQVEYQAKFVAVQIEENGITEIEFHSRTVEEDPQLVTYHNCIQMAAEIVKVPVTIVHRNFQE